VKFDVRVDLREVEKLATDMQRKQIPFAAARALTLTAKSAEQAVVGEMRKVFDRPTPWTLKSTYVQPAKKNSLVAMVKIKDDKNNARVAAIDWLAHSIYGGQRVTKGLEYLLRRYNKMPSNAYLVPAKTMKLDSYGNVSRGTIQRVISDLQSQAFDAGANSTKDSRRRRARSRTKRAVFYFSTWPKSAKTAHLKPGIYERTLTGFGSSVRPAFLFVSGARYKMRLDFYGVVEQRSKQVWPTHFQESLDMAMATAR
jgi:hypothetical protein